MDFNSIDWNTIWKEETASSHWGKSNFSRKEHWDKRAQSFSQSINRVVENQNQLDKDDYISRMLARIEVKPGWSVLDIGCGPGTLSVPLAKKAGRVTALDISSEMLKYLRSNAVKNGLNNIRYLNAPWEEALDNQQVGVHDVVVASRSLMPSDIKGTLQKIIAVTGKFAYLTFPVVHLPFDWEVYRAIGRGNKKHAPYIYIYNQLYQLGIQANVEILYSRVKMQFHSIEDAIREVEWRTDPFTFEERTKFIEFLNSKYAEQKDSPVFTHEGYSKWALIWWRNDQVNG
jgi:SAM-dependent methyltransferase